MNREMLNQPDSSQGVGNDVTPYDTLTGDVRSDEVSFTPQAGMRVNQSPYDVSTEPDKPLLTVYGEELGTFIPETDQTPGSVMSGGGSGENGGTTASQP
jgi:hypothetical protein